MATAKTTTVVGVFHDRSRAEEAVHALRQAGFRDNQVSLIRKGHEHEAQGEGHHAGSGAVAGAATGAGVAALASLGMTFGVIPIIGPILAVGPLAAALISAAGGAVAGGLVGSLIGMGIPEHEAKYYEGELQAGRTLVTVHADGRSSEAWSILQRYGAYSHQTASAATSTSTTSTSASSAAMSSSAATSGTGRAAQATSSGGQSIKVHEEELHARKTPVQAGEVRVRKEVVTEQQTLRVPVEREEVVIERRPASGKASASDLRAGEEIRIPVKEEQVRVEKDIVVKEEVNVGKRKVQDTENVSGTVRKERVRVEKEGDAEVHGDSVGSSRRK